MTWKEMKLAALQTMFSNEGADLNVDDNNRSFIYAMPAKANEAMMQIIERAKPLLKWWQIEVSRSVNAAVTTDPAKLTLPVQEALYRVSLGYYLPRFRCIDRGNVMMERSGDYAEATGWHSEGRDIFVFPGNVEGTYTIYYQAMPEKITGDTADNAVIDLPEDAAVLVPLYMASQLYKDDDVSLATAMRNEFEDGLAKLAASEAENRRSGLRLRGIANRTGWW